MTYPNNLVWIEGRVVSRGVWPLYLEPWDPSGVRVPWDFEQTPSCRVLNLHTRSWRGIDHPLSLEPWDCRLSKYHSQKPESTRRTIFNRGSTLQLIVQISSENVNSSVRARTKTHGRTLVSIELPRGRHLGSDACIS